MHINSLLSLSGLILTFLSFNGFADTLVKIFTDVEPYPHSLLVADRVEPQADYLLGLGPLQKIHGEWRHKYSLRVDADLQRITYQITGGRSVVSAMDYLESALPTTAVEVYRCEGRGCGSSAQWASLIFKQRELYGHDNEQHYVVYRLRTDNRLYHLAVYGIKRANNRQYLHFDILASSANKDTQTLVKMMGEAFSTERAFSLEELEEGQRLNQEQLSAIQAVTKIYAEELSLVAHIYGDESTVELIDRSDQWAQDIKNQLVSAAVKEHRIFAFGVGPLAPTGDGKARLDLVLKITN